MAINTEGQKRGFLWDNDYDGLVLNRTNFGSSSRGLVLAVAPTSATAGSRQGALAIYMTRTTTMTTSDGNPDCGLKIQVKNQTASESYARSRGIDVNVKADNSGNGNYSVNGAYITAESESGTNIGGEVTGIEVHAKNNGDATGGTVRVMRVYDESQSSTGTNYAISIDCTNNSAFTREYCVHINSGASSGWTNGLTFDGNITNVFDFKDNDGTNGLSTQATALSGLTSAYKVKCDYEDTTFYLIGVTAFE